MDNFPEFKLFDPMERLKRIGRFVGRLFLQMPHELPIDQQVPYDPFYEAVKADEGEWDG